MASKLASKLGAMASIVTVQHSSTNPETWVSPLSGSRYVPSPDSVVPKDMEVLNKILLEEW